MKINAIYSGKIYEKMMNASAGKRDDLYRYEMMKPLSTSGHVSMCRLRLPGKAATMW